jgi:hypothetical protein
MKWKDTRKAHMVPLALAGLLLAGQSSAADTPAQAREKELLQRLARSDAQAAVLLQRVEQLESRLEVLRAQVAATPKVAVSAPSGPMRAQPPAMAQAAPASGGNANPPAKRGGPGTFEVDEEAAQRALERTLTQSGALLLPPRTIEVTPSYTYRRVELNASVPASISVPGGPASAFVLANQRTRRNEHVARVDVRAGMPYATQLELGVPYNAVRSSQITEAGSAISTSSANGSGAGDITLGVAKTLFRERGAIPDLVGRLSYSFGNGSRSDDNVALLGGTRQLQAELTAIKRQDPLAFVATAFYGKAFEKDAIRPGDSAGISLSAILAASPATSLQFGFSQIHRREQENSGVKIPGSSQTYGVASIGASSVLSRDVTLITQFGIGVGSDAPEYSVSFALPFLFR